MSITGEIAESLRGALFPVASGASMAEEQTGGFGRATFEVLVRGEWLRVSVVRDPSAGLGRMEAAARASVGPAARAVVPSLFGVDGPTPLSHLGDPLAVVVETLAGEIGAIVTFAVWDGGERITLCSGKREALRLTFDGAHWSADAPRPPPPTPRDVELDAHGVPRATRDLAEGELVSVSVGALRAIERWSR